jgi:hypothetical protein
MESAHCTPTDNCGKLPDGNLGIGLRHHRSKLLLVPMLDGRIYCGKLTNCERRKKHVCGILIEVVAGTVLPVANQLKSLGVLPGNQLSSDVHVSAVVKACGYTIYVGCITLSQCCPKLRRGGLVAGMLALSWTTVTHCSTKRRTTPCVSATVHSIS